MFQKQHSVCRAQEINSAHAHRDFFQLSELRDANFSRVVKTAANIFS